MCANAPLQACWTLNIPSHSTNRTQFKLRHKWNEWKAEGELLPAAFDHAPNEADVRAALFAIEAVEWNRFVSALALHRFLLAIALLTRTS